jgi:hypothetical protein
MSRQGWQSSSVYFRFRGGRFGVGIGWRLATTGSFSDGLPCPFGLDVSSRVPPCCGVLSSAMVHSSRFSLLFWPRFQHDSGCCVKSLPWKGRSRRVGPLLALAQGGGVARRWVLSVIAWFRKLSQRESKLLDSGTHSAVTAVIDKLQARRYHLDRLTSSATAKHSTGSPGL